ncbi:MAG TPA: alpha/beta fold hydrolase [Anaerolineae bacterium]|nr:alpha/beta fold hydrolase [Anaerolineae bacterium]
MKIHARGEVRNINPKSGVSLMRASFPGLLVILLLMGILSACTGGDTSTPEETRGETNREFTTPTPTLEETLGFQPIFESTPCPIDLPPGAVEGENVVCGTVEVPEKHAYPEGKMIRLAVAIVKSEVQPAALEPLFMLAGGPGSSALTVFTPLLFSPLGAGFHADRDVVLVEQRGTLYSTPFLYCEENFELSLELMAQNLDAEERKPFLHEALSACYERLTNEGVDLSAYNSLENAADIVAVMRALGYENFNIYGGSYGTILAQHIMREYPKIVRSVILDAVAPLRHDPNLLYKAHSADRALRLFFSQCAEDPDCNSAYADMEKVFFETVDVLNESPTTLEVTNPYTGEAYPLLLTGDKLIQIMRDYLYYTQLLPSLPELINDIAAGEYGLLSAIQSSLIFRMEIADGMYKSVICSELVDFTAQDFADPEGLYPPVVRVMQGLLGEIWIFTCEVWDVEMLDESVKTSVQSDIPTLLLAGEFDPTVPPSMADVASEAMSKAYIYTFPGVGHGVLGTSECVTSIMLEFLADSSRAPDASCIQNLPGLVFDVPGQVVEITLEPFTQESLGIRGLSPAGWTEVQPGLFARGASAIDQTTLIYDVVPGEKPSVFIPGFQSLFGLESFPESSDIYEGAAFIWDLYSLEVELSGIPVHSFMALAEGETGAYVVLLISSPEEADSLYESVFLPVLQALVPVE